MAEMGRHVAADLAFAVGGGRTILTRQHVPYPFHITRPFQLDAARPDLATLYLQSASGGLYRADDLALNLAAARGAAVHVVTQAATVVHDTGAHPARQRADLVVEDGAFLAYTPDPLVLFPGAAIVNETRVRVAAAARAIVVDAFTWHDPLGRGRPFAALSQVLTVGDATGRVLVRDAGTVRGADLVGADGSAGTSPLGPFQASGTMVILAPEHAWPRGADLRAGFAETESLVGTSVLPNAAGVLLRCLARDGGDLRRGLDVAFAAAFASLTGTAPAPRRR